VYNNVLLGFFWKEQGSLEKEGVYQRFGSSALGVFAELNLE